MSYCIPNPSLLHLTIIFAKTQRYLRNSFKTQCHDIFKLPHYYYKLAIERARSLQSAVLISNVVRSKIPKQTA